MSLAISVYVLFSFLTKTLQSILKMWVQTKQQPQQKKNVLFVNVINYRGYCVTWNGVISDGNGKLLYFKKIFQYSFNIVKADTKKNVYKIQELKCKIYKNIYILYIFSSPVTQIWISCTTQFSGVVWKTLFY